MIEMSLKERRCTSASVMWYVILFRQDHTGKPILPTADLPLRSEDWQKERPDEGMKRLLLFSRPGETVKQKIVPLLFPHEIDQKVFAFLPSEGLRGSEKYIDLAPEWQALAEQHHAEFVLIDNAAEEVAEEHAKLRRANILFITGGNTCLLSRNLRRSGLDRIIREFTQQEHYVLAGYSAGAMILTPSIEYEVVAFDPCANEEAGLLDFEGLHLVEYEIAPHYIDEDEEVLEAYRKTRSYEVRALTDDEYLLVEREHAST